MKFKSPEAAGDIIIHIQNRFTHDGVCIHWDSCSDLPVSVKPFQSAEYRPALHHQPMYMNIMYITIIVKPPSCCGEEGIRYIKPSSCWGEEGIRYIKPPSCCGEEGIRYIRAIYTSGHPNAHPLSENYGDNHHFITQGPPVVLS